MTSVLLGQTKFISKINFEFWKKWQKNWTYSKRVQYVAGCIFCWSFWWRWSFVFGCNWQTFLLQTKFLFFKFSKTSSLISSFSSSFCSISCFLFSSFSTVYSSFFAILSTIGYSSFFSFLTLRWALFFMITKMRYIASKSITIYISFGIILSW